jgi:hypothetical protein
VTRTVLQILWPAFVAAAALEILVFAHVDPTHVRTLAGTAIELSEKAVYTLSFFGFWLVVAAACGASWWLQQTKRGA